MVDALPIADDDLVGRRTNALSLAPDGLDRGDTSQGMVRCGDSVRTIPVRGIRPRLPRMLARSVGA